MKLPQHSHRRPGFTLIEMMVVIAILIIMFSLIAGAVLRVMVQGPRVVAANDLSQLGQSVESFRQKYNMYPPSRIFLANTPTDYTNAATFYTNKGDAVSAQVVQSSMGLLQRIFPKLDWTGNSGVIDWTGGQVPYAQFKGAMLEGDQCLVFFLGGMQTSMPGQAGTNGCLGFAANSHNPTLLSGARNNPLYEFPSNRLIVVPRPNPLTPNIPNPFFSYLDAFGLPTTPSLPYSGQPYAYFSTYGNRNGYSPFGGSDCPTLGLAPYYEAPVPQVPPSTQPVRYLNPNSFQIITAGADKVFGSGGYWNPIATPGVDPSTGDNQSNFNGGAMMLTRS